MSISPNNKYVIRVYGFIDVNVKGDTEREAKEEAQKFLPSDFIGDSFKTLLVEPNEAPRWLVARMVSPSNFETEVECPICGRKIKIGQMLVSSVEKNTDGESLLVCPSCYSKEVK